MKKFLVIFGVLGFFLTSTASYAYVPEPKSEGKYFTGKGTKASEQYEANAGMPVYDYDAQGCTSNLKICDFCSKQFDDAIQKYNRNTFFIFALIGFILIVAGLFVHTLLLQLVTLPAGAFLVIEAAVKNFDNKLAVIIVFALLIVAAIILALRKLK